MPERMFNMEACALEYCKFLHPISALIFSRMGRNRRLSNTIVNEKNSVRDVTNSAGWGEIDG